MGEGRILEQRAEWEGALRCYEKALAEDSSEVVYRMAAYRARTEAAHIRMQRGLTLRSQGAVEQARAEFEAAARIDPGLPAATQELRRTGEMAPGQRLTPAERAREKGRREIGKMLPAPDLQPLSRDLITLKMMNQSPRILFETVGRYAGINVLFDPEYVPPKNMSLELTDSTLTQALDYLAVLSKSYWKALSSNAIFVTNDNPNKRRDYEDHVTKTFYLTNVNSTQELQEIVNAIRSATDLQRVIPYTSQYAIVVRGEADKVALAGKIIQDLDKARAEVLLDILVLQTSRTFSKQITAALASSGLNVPVNFSPRSGIQVNTSSPDSSDTSSTSTAIALASLGHLASSDFSITLPGALLQAALSDANTRILQAPQIRATDNIKASLKIGERQPTATGSYSAGTGTTAVSALVNTQFTYLDVGVNVEILPRVHDNGEMSLHIELDISSVTGQVDLGGINEPIIGQRKVVHDIRVRAGEVSLLGGLINEQESKTLTGIPGLSSIPVIRRLFTSSSVDRSRSELMIVLIPHIVRGLDVSPDNLRPVAVGNATTVKLNYGQ